MSKLYVDEILSSSSSNIKISNGLGIVVGSNINPSLTFDSIGGIIAQQPYWNIVEQQTSGTTGHAGATFSSGSWVTRILNTTIGTNTITGASLSSNRFTLPSGTYRILVTAPAFYVDSHKIKLANITDSTDTLIGTSAHSSSANTGGINTESKISGIFTINSSKTFEIQHRCAVSKASNGFGIASSFSVAEIYTVIELWKLGN
jgi:hypothetical protein